MGLLECSSLLAVQVIDKSGPGKIHEVILVIIIVIIIIITLYSIIYKYFGFNKEVIA